MMQKKQNDKKRKRFYRIVGMVVMILALLGIFLPGWLLVLQSEVQMDMVAAVPVEYYSPANLAVARNASANLGIYQKLQLITGRWESNLVQAESWEREMADYEAVELAKEQLDVLYQNGLYPARLISAYGNWYSWEAEFHKVVDATFNTYTAYYWDITFEKYDGSERHHMYMLEDGTIFFAEAWEIEGVDITTISKVSDIEIDLLLEENKIMKQRISEISQNPKEYFTFTDIETTDLQWMDMMKLRVEEQEYYVLQANSVNCYLYSLQAAN